MWIKSVADGIHWLISPASRGIHYVGAFFLFLMMWLVVVHVAGRYVLDYPVPGAVELIEFLMTFVVFLGFGYGAVMKANVTVDLFVDKLPKRIQAIIDAATCLLSIGIISLITWQGMVQAKSLFCSGHVSGVLNIPHYPFLIILVVGYAVFNVVLIAHFFEHLQGVCKK